MFKEIRYNFTQNTFLQSLIGAVIASLYVPNGERCKLVINAKRQGMKRCAF